MRSLFTTDIPGAVPSNRYYDKELYRKRHLEEVQRFGPKNPEDRRVIEWYNPPKKVVEPLEKDSSIVKPHNRAYQEHDSDNTSRLSKSVILNKIDSVEITGKVTEGISLRKSSNILSTAAKKSLTDSDNFSQDHLSNPYFPHRFSSKHEENPSKYTGIRDWNNGHQKIDIPSVDKQYFPKWS